MKDIYLGFKFSFSYFSNIPVKFKASDDLSKPKVLASMIFFLPFVGMVISLFSVAVFLIFEQTQWLAAIVAAIFYMILYGFIHTEAIMDVVDAIYAKHSGKDPYKVIKESTVGATGVLYAVAFIILKVATLSYMFLNGMFLEIVAIAIISRMLLQINIYFQYFRSSFVEVLKSSFKFKYLIVSIFIYSLVGFFLIDVSFFILLLIAIFVSFSISYYLKKQLGFLNGDTLGFNLELLELLLLLILII